VQNALRRLQAWNPAIRFRSSNAAGCLRSYTRCIHLRSTAYRSQTSIWQDLGTDIAKKALCYGRIHRFVLMIQLALPHEGGGSGGLEARALRQIADRTGLSMSAQSRSTALFLDGKSWSITFPVRYGVIVGVILCFGSWTAVRSKVTGPTQVSRIKLLAVSGNSNKPMRDIGSTWSAGNALPGAWWTQP
jgi:hypothetical protein